MGERLLNAEGRYDTYTWEFDGGTLWIGSHCCGDHFDEAELRVLYDTLKEHYDE